MVRLMRQTAMRCLAQITLATVLLVCLGIGVGKAENFGDRVQAPAQIDQSILVEASFGLQKRSLQVDGRARVYHIYIPRSLRQTGAGAPAVVGFHGGGGNPLGFARRVGLRRLADERDAIVLLPAGLGRGGKGSGSWNTASANPQGFAARNNVDDLAFITAMLADADSIVAIDQSRTYALGFSMGGMMAYHAACTLRGHFAAIAVVAGTFNSTGCRYADDVSLLHIHGAADENVPFAGGRGSLTGRNANWPGVSPGIDLFLNANACSLNRKVIKPARDTTCQAVACSGAERIELCLVEGGGHGWPGTEPAEWQRTNNVYVSPYFDATSYIADFLFSR